MLKNNTCSNVRCQIQKICIFRLPKIEHLASNTCDCLAYFGQLAAASAFRLKSRKWGSLVHSAQNAFRGLMEEQQ